MVSFKTVRPSAAITDGHVPHLELLLSWPNILFELPDVIVQPGAVPRGHVFQWRLDVGAGVDHAHDDAIEHRADVIPISFCDLAVFCRS